MRFLARLLLLVLVVGGLGLGAAWWLAGREPGPVIEIVAPTDVIGQAGTLEAAFTAPGGQLSHAEAVLEQNGQRTTVFSLDQAISSTAGDMEQTSADRIVIRRPIGRQAVPTLASGPATIEVTAARPVFFGLRQATTTVTRDVTVRLEPPRVSVVSTHHYVNHGGAEFVVYRATPADVASGVRVGDREYPGYPGTAVGLQDPSMRVAFFALAFDQELNAPISVFARDVAGNQALASLEHRAFAKQFGRSNIEISDNFLSRVVPPIAANTPSLGLSPSTPEELLSAFLVMNGQLRQENNQTIAALSAKSRPEMMWSEAFSQLGNSAVESRFADYRTYFHNGDEIDRQVHLGFDLASTTHAPVHAANRGVVVFAEYLGIYGNCVIIDHGLGVQSLYAHLSQIDVKPGETVAKGQGLGRTGSTGMAGGDHLHFTMVVSGTQVNPVEFWDAHWMEDRVLRKVREAMGQ
ncbi:MAG: M23 family metallopeptidase [Vicinamibacterales bacterium]